MPSKTVPRKSKVNAMHVTDINNARTVEIMPNTFLFFEKYVQAGRYIDGSFLYDCEVYVYTNQIRVETKFAVKTPDKSRYDVSYTVSLYDGSKKIDKPIA